MNKVCQGSMIKGFTDILEKTERVSFYSI